MRAHHVLLLSLCLLAAAYAVLLFVSPAAAPIGVTLTVVWSGAGLDALCVARQNSWLYSTKHDLMNLLPLFSF